MRTSNNFLATTSHITTYNSSNGYTLNSLPATSGASRNRSKISTILPAQIPFKKLLYSKKWDAGRGGSLNHIIFRKNGTRKNLKIRNISINYNFRHNYLFFIGGFYTKPSLSKLISLVFISSGSVMYIQNSPNHQIFAVTKLQSYLYKMSKNALKLSFIYNKILITQTLFTLIQLKKNQPISLLEIVPGRGIQYARAVGTGAVAIKMDSRTGTGLVKLPSGVKKIFSVYSLASTGQVSLSFKKKIKITSGGFFKKMGKKSITRGVAKNPVDHPHGGRNKAIRYQRTPWGKTTKFK